MNDASCLCCRTCLLLRDMKNIDDNEILSMTKEVGMAEAVETNSAAENFREFEALISR